MSITYFELQAYAEIMEEEKINIPAWFCFNSKDGSNVVSGDSLLECVSIAESCKKVVAVGINCTPPRFIHGLISSIKKVLCTQFVSIFWHLSSSYSLIIFPINLFCQVSTKPIVIYPNSGESYDADKKEWVVSFHIGF